VRRSNFLNATLFGQGGEKPIPFISSHRLDIAFAHFRPGSREIYFSEMKRKRQPLRQPGNKERILPALCAPNSVLEMSHLQTQAQFSFQAGQQMKERHGVRSSGNGY